MRPTERTFWARNAMWEKRLWQRRLAKTIVEAKCVRCRGKSERKAPLRPFSSSRHVLALINIHVGGSFLLIFVALGRTSHGTSWAPLLLHSRLLLLMSATKAPGAIAILFAVVMRELTRTPPCHQKPLSRPVLSILYNFKMLLSRQI